MSITIYTIILNLLCGLLILATGVIYLERVTKRIIHA
jgi:hypothetical protein